MILSNLYRRGLVNHSLISRVAKRTSSTGDSSVASGGDKIHGSYHWLYERYISIGLLPLVGYPIMMGPSRTCDLLLGLALPLHCHLGFSQIITDYLNKRKIGNVMNKGVFGLLYGATALTVYGFYKFNTQDIGITEYVRQLWHGPAEKKK